MKLVILSPHRDDAAFSCAIAIAALAQLGITIVIVNLFTISAYAPYSSWTGSSEISELRRLEDLDFLQQPRITASMLDLAMKDAPLRLEVATDRLLEDCLGCDALEEEISKVSLGFGHLLTQIGDVDAVMLPLALGNHIDHRIARDAGLRVARGKALAFYEDLPYACHLSATRIEKYCTELMVSTALRLSAHLIHAAEGSALKQRCAAIYRSQIASDVVTMISGYAAAKGGGERLHATREWLSLIELAQEKVTKA